ncbi:MAG: hypothetical protein V4581_06105 [Bacteroidota bacterium]
MPYLILFLLFGLPLLPFLKKFGAFSGFTYIKFVMAFNRASIIYLVLGIGFAFLFAYLDSAYSIIEDGSWLNITAEVCLSFISILLVGIVPLYIILNIIKWFIQRKSKTVIPEEEKLEQE